MLPIVLPKVFSTFLRSIVFIAAVSAAGASQIGCVTLETSTNTFLDPGFTDAKLQRLAVFPIVNTRLPLSDAQKLYGDLTQAIVLKRPSVVIINSAQAVGVLNEKGLGNEWTRFLRDRDAKGLSRPGVLKAIGRALNVDGILQGDIVSMEQKDGVFGHHQGTTRATVRYYLMEVESGKLLWEGSTDGLLTTATPVDPTLPIIEAVKLAHQKMLEILPF
jgi:hypothetical protein